MKLYRNTIHIKKFICGFFILSFLACQHAEVTYFGVVKTEYENQKVSENILQVPDSGAIYGQIDALNIEEHYKSLFISVSDTNQIESFANIYPDGTYIIEGLQGQPYTFSIWGGNYVAQERNVFLSHDNSLEVKVSLKKRAQFSGRVLGMSKDSPVSNAELIIYDDKVFYSDETKADGSFQIDRITPGVYSLKINAIGYEEYQLSKLKIKEEGYTIDYNLQAYSLANGVKGSIRGRIKDRATRVYLEGIQIMAFDKESHFYSAVSDSMGFYQINDMEFGTYTVTSLNQEYLRLNSQQSLTAGNSEVVFDVDLSKSYSLGGEVGFDQGSNEAKDILISVYQNDNIVQANRIKKAGFFEFQSLPYGIYSVEVTCEGFVTEWYHDIQLSNIASDRLKFKLTKGYTVSGRVMESASIGVAGCTVMAYSDDGDIKVDTTDALGYYTIGGLGNKFYDVVVSSEELIYPPQNHLKINKSIKHLDFTNNIGGALKGKVYAANGEPGIDIEVLIEKIDISPIDENHIFNTKTDDKGEYLIRNMPEGKYNISLVSDNSLYLMKEVVIASDEVYIDIFMDKAKNISGTIDRVSGGEEIPVENAEIIISHNSLTSISSTCYSDRNGHFVTENLPVGDYSVQVNYDDSMAQLIPNIHSSSQIKLRWNEFNGEVKGLVVSDKKPLAGMPVIAVSKEYKLNTMSNSKGEFFFTAMPVGEYLILVDSKDFITELISFEINKENRYHEANIVAKKNEL